MPYMKTLFSVYLLELRFRLFYVILSFLFTFFVCTQYNLSLTHLICLPFTANNLANDENKFLFIFTHITEGLYTAIQLSFLSALFFSFPLCVYQLYSFFIPIKYEKEKKEIDFILLSMCVFWLISLNFSFFLIWKFSAFLQQFQYSGQYMEIKLQARIAPAVQWNAALLFFISFFFQLIFIYFLLGQAGYISQNPRRMWKNRKYAYFSFLLLASLLSPPDISFQFLVTAIFCLVYEFLLFSAFFSVSPYTAAYKT